MSGDKLAERLTAKGFNVDLVDAICERAAINEHDGEKSRWKAGVDAQVQLLGRAEVIDHDI